MSKKYTEGLVTVIIPTYKRSEYLMRAVQSALNQTYPFIEIIVVNDNEAGDEYSLHVDEMLKKFPTVKCITPLEHKNGAAARNFGLSNATGTYIAFLDDDDYWEKRKIEKQIKMITSLDETYIAVSTLKRFIANDKIIRLTDPYIDGDVKKAVIYREIEISTSTILIKREVIQKMGGFDENLSRRQDLQLFIQLFQYGKLKLINEYLTNMDISDDQNRKFTLSSIREMESLFFASIKNELEDYSLVKRKGIKRIYNFESGVCLIKVGHVISGIIMCLPILLHPYLFYKQIKRKKCQINEKNRAKEKRDVEYGTIQYL